MDLVLNCEFPGAWGPLYNAVMASAPGNTFWLTVLQEAMRRAPAAAAADYDNPAAVLQSTGPWLLTYVYQVRWEGCRLGCHGCLV